MSLENDKVAYGVQEPLVSVILPAYNHDKYVAESINSVLKQSYTNFELIIINDGSSDSTDEIISSIYNENKSAIKYISKKNEGLIKTLNLALKISKGRYITFIASDDKWMREKLKIQVDFMQKNPDIYMSFTDAYFLKQFSETSIKYTTYKPNIKKIFKKDKKNIFNKMIIENLVISLTTIIKREFIEELGFFDEDLIYEDYDMWLRVSKKHKISYIDRVTAYYRIHDANFSRNTRKMIKGTLQILFKHYKLPPINRNPFKVAYFFSRFVMRTIVNRIKKNKL